jgi:hypothetical protein
MKMKIEDAVEYEESIAGNQDSRVSLIVEPVFDPVIDDYFFLYGRKANSEG